jgi:hypothetical protein
MKIFFDFNLGRQSYLAHELTKYWKDNCVNDNMIVV